MTQPRQVDAIKTFLTGNTLADLAGLYNAGMECQVNVAQDGGERIDGEFMGRRWHGWTDGLTTWKSFRIPYKANTDPEYDLSRAMKFDLAAHVEAIGMTGWDWQQRVSHWFAFDFDALVGHSDKHNRALTHDQLLEVQEAAHKIPWVEIRKSTSGKGLHLYVYVDNVKTANHNEHAALARSVLGEMAAIVNYDFHSQVDICGGNMWVWHRKMRGTEGLTVIKKAEGTAPVPPHWRDHIKVVTGVRRKTLPTQIEEHGREDLFEEMCGQRPHVPLDSEHKKLLDYLRSIEAFAWWDKDNHMLVTHTYWLKKAHTELDLQGIFETATEATNINEQNCFAFPHRRGAWTVRRYTPGVREHPSWEQDGAGWTRCYLNHEPNLDTTARTHGGLEDPTGGFVFLEGEVAETAARELGASVEIGVPLRGRETKLKSHKDGRLLVEVERKPTDRGDTMPGWLAKPKKWVKLFQTQAATTKEPETANFDDMLRHLITPDGEDCGWYVKSTGIWAHEPVTHVKAALTAQGLKSNDIQVTMGSNVMRPWSLVNRPFEPEYPGGREWNRHAAKFRFTPTPDIDSLSYPTWLKILNHTGAGLNEAIKNNSWAKANGVLTGAEYLKCWIASCFQEPSEPVPYLFFWSKEQATGKSIFHEALSLLITRGYQRADLALTSTSGFNGELEGAIFCIVEEVDLAKERTAYNRIKDWVTSPQLNVRHMYRKPYHIVNTTHWIQCANDHRACPVFPGDTRVTMAHVPILDPLDMIPKKKLIPLLEKEAPDFLAAVLRLELPEPGDRLNIPVIETEDKRVTALLKQSAFDTFLSENCKNAEGYTIKFGTFYDKFIEWLLSFDPEKISEWSKIRVGREVGPLFPKGRSTQNAQFHIGNIAWVGQDTSAPKKKLMLRGEYLTEVS
jgi:hypothetical protein